MHHNQGLAGVCLCLAGMQALASDPAPGDSMQMPLSEQTWQQASVEHIADNQLRQLLSDYQFALALEKRQFDESLGEQPWQPDFVLYRASQFKYWPDYDTPMAMSVAFVNSLEAVSGVADKSSWTLHWGFDLPFEHQLELPFIQRVDGLHLAMPIVPGLTQGLAQTADIERFSMFFRLRSRPSDPQQQPEFIGGYFRVELPVTVLQFEFEPDAVGSTQTRNGFAVTLTGFEDARFSVEITPGDEYSGEPLAILQDGHVVGEGIAADGRFIERAGESRFNADYLERLNDWLNTTIESLPPDVSIQALQADYEALERKLSMLAQSNDNEVSSYSKSFAFYGTLSKVRVNILLYPKEKHVLESELALPITVSPAPDASARYE